MDRAEHRREDCAVVAGKGAAGMDRPNTPFHHAPRGPMPPARRARIFALRGGICGDASLGNKNWGCGRKLRPGDKWSVEHHPALENGGEDIDEKCWIVCEWCRPKKDAADHKQAAKAKRIFTRACGAHEPERPMEYTRLKGRFKRTFSGRTVER